MLTYEKNKCPDCDCWCISKDTDKHGIGGIGYQFISPKTEDDWHRDPAEIDCCNCSRALGCDTTDIPKGYLVAWNQK